MDQPWSPRLRLVAVLLIGVVLAVAAAVWLALGAGTGSFDAQVLAAKVRGTGWLGPAVLLLLLVVQSVIAPLPSQPVLMAAGFVYGSTAGFALGWLGVATGACACFGLARVLGRPFVHRFVGAERVAAVDTYVERRGLAAAFFTLLSLRLFVHISFDAVSYACGLIRFPFRWFLFATAVGEIPKVFAFTYLGAGLGAAAGWATVLMAAGIAGAVVAWLWLGRRAKSGGL